MRAPSVYIVLAASAATLILNACAAGPSSVTPVAGRQVAFARPQSVEAQSVSKGPSHKIALSCNSATNLLYVSQTVANKVNIYNSPPGLSSPLLYTITSSQGLNNPLGMISSISTTVLYVANYSAKNVLLFKKCGSGPGGKLQDAPYNPTDVAVTAGSPVTAYVSNDSPANVTVFPANSSNYNPSLTLSDPNAQDGVGITIDKFGNCFWSFIDTSGQGRVDRFVNCTMPGTTIALFTSLNGRPGGVQLDFPANRLLVDARADNKTYRIPSPWTGSPFTFPITPGAQPWFLSLRNPEIRLYVADTRNGQVLRYIYPSGATQAPITTGLTIAGGVAGVAVYPAAPL